jgi:hypothetical protein
MNFLLRHPAFRTIDEAGGSSELDDEDRQDAMDNMVVAAVGGLATDQWLLDLVAGVLCVELCKHRNLSDIKPHGV